MRMFVAAALLLAVVIGTVVLFSSEEPAPTTIPAVDTSEPAASITPEVSEPITSDAFSEDVSSEPAPDATERARCERFRIDQAHPWFIAEMARIEPLSPSGPGMAVYRGLSEADLQSLAAQKDSGAMIVLGRRAELRAYGKPEDEAVNQLDGQQSVSRSWSMTGDVDADVQAALQDAARWYYQAVLHGRIFALFNVGILHERLNGGAVELGWVDEDTYDDMDTDQRTELYPPVVYGAAATALATEVVDSPLMTLAFESQGLDRPAGDPVAVELVISQLRADLQQSSLSLPSVSPYEGPSLEEWRAEFCKQ